jgi:hypothetical protein
MSIVSTERLALLVAGALILVSAAGIAYLAAEQAGAAKQPDVPVDPAPTAGTPHPATERRSTTRIDPRTRPRVAPPETPAQGGLGRVSRVTADAMVSGAFRAASPAIGWSGTEQAILNNGASKPEP